LGEGTVFIHKEVGGRVGEGEDGNIEDADRHAKKMCGGDKGKKVYLTPI
jgi:hypothetical protein